MTDTVDLPYFSGITVNYCVLQRCNVLENSLNVRTNICVVKIHASASICQIYVPCIVSDIFMRNKELGQKESSRMRCIGELSAIILVKYFMFTLLF